MASPPLPKKSTVASSSSDTKFFDISMPYDDICGSSYNGLKLSTSTESTTSMTSIAESVSENGCEDDDGVCDDDNGELMNDTDSIASNFTTRSDYDRTSSPTPASPRSIFQRYWDSPKSCDTPTNNKVEEEEENFVRRLKKLQMPLVNKGDEEDIPVSTQPREGHTPSKNNIISSPPSRPISDDDNSIHYTASQLPSSPTSKRRQILPTPPPSPLSVKQRCSKPCCRPWSSTSALIKKPKNSCLRPARYSFSSVGCKSGVEQRRRSASLGTDLEFIESSDVSTIRISGTEGSNEEDSPRTKFKKGVSFYSEVSVVEFTVPQERRVDGWSNYFV
jgi:hypothetical protein